jgi:hypothetical protein
MTQKVGSPGGFKTNAEYDAAWAGLHKINEEMYGEKNIYGGRGPNRNRLSDAPQQPQPNTPSPTGKAPDMSVYTPGKAQPTQTQSQGTPYGQLPPTGSPATSYADAWNAAMPKGGNGVTFTPARSVIGAGAGNMAYAQPDQRPQGFVTQSYDLQGNPVAQGQQAQQRDAFIAQILQTPRETPQYDFQGMLGKAGDMVKDGWQNPFNFNQPQTPSPGPQAPPGGQPSSQRYTPVAPVVRGDMIDHRAREENAARFISELERANPATWSNQQWSDYESAKNHLSTTTATYYRGQDGQVNRSRHRNDPTLGDDDFTWWRNSKNLPAGAAYNRAENERLFEQYMSETGGERQSDFPTQPPQRDPVATPVAPRVGGQLSSPGAAQPSSPGVQGRPDNRMAIQDLFTKNNIQAPQGFMDQLIALLGGSAPPTQMPPRSDVAAPEPKAPVSPPQQHWGLQRPVGKRLLFRGDMNIPEEYIGTEAFESLLREEAARPTPPYIPQQTVSPPPVANPGTATPTPPKPSGTPPLPPPPPPPRVLTDADVAAQEDEIRRLKGLDWARANPNNWFMNPYMQDNPRVREVRSRNPTVNKSGKGGGGSSNRKFTNVNGKMKWT